MSVTWRPTWPSSHIPMLSVITFIPRADEHLHMRVLSASQLVKGGLRLVQGVDRTQKPGVPLSVRAELSDGRPELLLGATGCTDDVQLLPSGHALVDGRG